MPVIIIILYFIILACNISWISSTIPPGIVRTFFYVISFIPGVQEIVFIVLLVLRAARR